MLSESTLRGRGTTDRSDGGVSNTGDPTSFALTVDGGNVAGVENLAYRVAYIRQAPGQGDDGDEKGFNVALSHEFGFGHGLTLSPLYEFVHFRDADGSAGRRRDFHTLAARLDWTEWNLSVGHTGRETRESNGSRVDDFQFQISTGYAFSPNISLDFGWLISNESGIEVRRLGALLAYSLSF